MACLLASLWGRLRRMPAPSFGVLVVPLRCPPALPLWRGKLPGGTAYRSNACVVGHVEMGGTRKRNSTPLIRCPRTPRRFLAMRAGRSTGPTPDARNPRPRGGGGALHSATLTPRLVIYRGSFKAGGRPASRYSAGGAPHFIFSYTTGHALKAHRGAYSSLLRKMHSAEAHPYPKNAARVLATPREVHETLCFYIETTVTAQATPRHPLRKIVVRPLLSRPYSALLRGMLTEPYFFIHKGALANRTEEGLLHETRRIRRTSRAA